MAGRAMAMQIEPFGQMADGTKVKRITLSAGGLRAKILTYGAVLQDLRLEGHAPALVLGFEQFSHYLQYSPYFGANVGRCGNRIRDGHARIDGTDYQLDRNFLDKHHLHGGRLGAGQRVWDIEALDAQSATFQIRLADGEMGYPGNMTLHLTYTLLQAGMLDIQYRATSDKPTLCNIAHHSYFNLDGSATAANHQLYVDAESYLPVNGELIPTGEIRPVKDTRFDFRAAKALGAVSKIGILDHNFCLSSIRLPLRPVASLASARSGVRMDIQTTEPGLQVYDGAKINIPVPGLDARPLGPFAGVALEPQIWPDANHHQSFPQARLSAEGTYFQHTQYIFSKERK